MATPLSKSVTQRMLRQAAGSRTDATARYLRAFGVTDVSLQKIPAVFDAKHTPEWKAFLSANTELHGDPGKRALQAILSFIRYCQALKIDPFVKNFNYKDPLTSSSRLNVMTIRKTLMNEELHTAFKAMQNEIYKTALPQFMRVFKTRVNALRTGADNKLIAVYVLETSSNRQSLDMVLKSMGGSLYTGDLPPQLAPMFQGKIDKRPPADALLVGLGTAGWYPISRNEAFSLWITRAKKDMLVVKAIVSLSPESKDNGDIPIKDRVASWTKFKLFR